VVLVKAGDDRQRAAFGLGKFKKRSCTASDRAAGIDYHRPSPCAWVCLPDRCIVATQYVASIQSTYYKAHSFGDNVHVLERKWRLMGTPLLQFGLFLSRS
jgi:hypothetical protein